MGETKKEKRPWLGGYVRPGKKGPTYVIERWVNGVHFHVSTKCRTERAALKELERFEADPRGYRQGRGAKTRSAELTPELLADYLAHMEGRHLDPDYIDQTEGYLSQVMVTLAGRDLSRLTFIELREAIDAASDAKLPAARAARARSVKALCKWMRREKGLLNRANDPSLDLTIGRAPPEKNKRRKAMSVEVVERAIQSLPPDVADVAIVLAHTGLHVREVKRVHAGEGGLYEPQDWQKAEGVLANLAVQHKRNLLTKDGGHHVVALTSQGALDAMKRILARKTFPTQGRLTRQVINHNKRSGDHFNLGWLRHTVATWAALQRESDEAIANALGHVDTSMVRRVYKDLGLAARPIRLPTLKLVKG